MVFDLHVIISSTYTFHAETVSPDNVLFLITGTGKSTVYKLLQRVLKAVRTELDDNEISYKKWTLSDQTFEKLGELMYQNDSKALGLYDELTNFLSQVNLYSGNKGLLDTHEFTKVLEMFIAAEWSRQTGKSLGIITHVFTVNLPHSVSFY